MDHIRRGDEENLGKIVLHVEVVIHERAVLFGIEHFQQRRGGIATKVHAHFVHFVQQEHRVGVAGLLHHLNNLTGKSADIGAPVAADFCLIADPTQR